MRPADLHFALDWRDGSPLRRGSSFALAVGAHILIFLLLWGLAPSPPRPLDIEPPLATFDLAPAAEEERAPAPRRRTAPARRASGGVAQPSPAPPPPPVPAPQPTSTPPITLPGVMPLDSFDLANVPRRAAEPGDGGDAAGGESMAAYGPGEGPGGQRLFNAEWRREPTDAELNGYLPAGAPPGSWAIIACRTIEDYQVDNCRILGESPLGSGIARAMRQAAWQFRILPPRVGGKKLVGAWVRIRFDFGRERVSR